ncbi:MAG: rRNA maturation RNase YbeY [Candidatus Fermentibacteraceae bacterium]|nr:rRNA maturation RNase YbeY [Candidatus Fermentibacteraceae bacterium]
MESDTVQDAPNSSTPSPIVSIVLQNPAPELQLLDTVVQKTVTGSVEFVVCDPGVMRFLNYNWRRINKPTDVLTFDLSVPGDTLPQGVIYIDGRMAPPLEEVLERVYHGLLHLQGYTHNTEEETTQMNRLTVELVKKGMKAVQSI